MFTQELAHARIRRDCLTVAFLDLDNFKMINDTYGHEGGDQVLCRVADQLKTILRGSDIIARIGGDEFAILFPHIGNDEIIQLIGNKILNIFENTVDLNGSSMRVTASFGFSVYPRDGDDIDSLLHKADKAMYAVKANHKDNYLIYKE